MESHEDKIKGEGEGEVGKESLSLWKKFALIFLKNIYFLIKKFGSDSSNNKTGPTEWQLTNLFSLGRRGELTVTI